MWFRGRGRKQAEQDTGDATQTGSARRGKAVLAGKGDLPRMPRIKGVTQPTGAPTRPMANMWDCVDPTLTKPQNIDRAPAAPLAAVAPPAAPATLEMDAPAPPDLGAPEPTFGSAPAPAAEPQAAPASAGLPVGWLVVTEGPGRGAAFVLEDGVSDISRNPAARVCLDFGDEAISAKMHATLAYDAEANGFFVAPATGRSIVRMNGKPVLTTEPIASFDTIRIGATTLVFVALCSDRFEWDSLKGAA